MPSVYQRIIALLHRLGKGFLSGVAVERGRALVYASCMKIDDVPLEIRLLAPEDSVADLTALIRRAYRQLADLELKYVATWQDEAITRRRAERGECYVALLAGRPAGTIVFYPPGSAENCAYYERPGVAVFGQFAVEPELQGYGIGARLLAHVEQRACEVGAAEIALDTSDRATHLIELYERFGYAVVGAADWDETNYKSVIMAKKVG